MTVPLWPAYLVVGMGLIIAPGPLDWLNYKITGHHIDGSLGCGLIVGGITLLVLAVVESVR